MSVDPVAEVQWLLSVGRSDTALDRLGPALAAAPDDAELHLLAAHALHDRGDHAGSLASADRAAALDPHDDGPHHLRALALSRLGRDDEAVAAGLEAVRVAPHAPWNHAALAQVAAERRRHRATARRAAERAVTLAAESAEAHFSVGYVAQARGRKRAARRAYRRALALDPHHAEATHNLGQVGGGSAAAGLDRALRLEPHHPDLHRSLDSFTVQGVFATWVMPLVVLAHVLAVHWVDGYSRDVGIAPGPADDALLLTGLLAALVLGSLVVMPSTIRRHVLRSVRSDRHLGAMALLTLVSVTAVVVVGAGPPSAVLHLGVVPALVLPGLLILRARGRVTP